MTARRGKMPGQHQSRPPILRVLRDETFTELGEPVRRAGSLGGPLARVEREIGGGPRETIEREICAVRNGLNELFPCRYRRGSLAHALARVSEIEIRGCRARIN